MATRLYPREHLLVCVCVEHTHTHTHLMLNIDKTFCMYFFLPYQIKYSRKNVIKTIYFLILHRIEK